MTLRSRPTPPLCVALRKFGADGQTPALAASSNIYFGRMTFSLTDGYRYRGVSYASIDAVMDAAMPTVDASLSVRRAASIAR